MLDLILKDIQDPYVRENFFRLRKFLGRQVIFDGDFKFFNISIPGKDKKFKVPHGLTYIPADIIQLSSEGDYNYYFLYNDFDKDNLYIVADGAVQIRFLAGKLSDQVGSQSTAQAATQAPPFVAPGDVIQPASPGFVYGAAGAKTAGFWLTSEAIPSNVVGIPVLFGDAKAVQAAVGTEVEANYTIGIYQHEGAGVNLTLVGQFDVTIGGPKRLAFNFPITSTSPNVQLATRLIAGNTLNLKVSLIVKGSGI